MGPKYICQTVKKRAMIHLKQCFLIIGNQRNWFRHCRVTVTKWCISSLYWSRRSLSKPHRKSIKNFADQHDTKVIGLTADVRI